MKLLFDVNELKREFEFYKDQIAPKGEEIIEINFWKDGEKLNIDEIEIVFGKEDSDKSEEN